MNWLMRVLGGVGMLLVAAVVLTLLLMAFSVGGLLMGFPLAAIYGWVVYTFFHYRFCRQDELVHLLASAAEAGVPLAGALRAYLHDRPRGSVRELLIATVMFFIFPFFYWIWHRRNSFDRRVEDLAHKLEIGFPLHQALQTTPGVASRETVMAAAMGQVTGQLAQSLRSVSQRRLGAVWLEMFPRFIYPMALLLVIGGILGFLMYFIVPKFKKIFLDFGIDLPKSTMLLIRGSDWVINYALVAVPFIALLVLVPIWSPAILWFLPGFGAVHRRYLQSRILDMLAHLMQIGKPVPEALSLIASMPLGGAVLSRLEGARYRTERGEMLAESLSVEGLLPHYMVPLVHAAERAGNLPWALAELADSLFHRTVRLLQRVMQVVFPTTVVAVGSLVGLIVIALFVPLVKLITTLSG